MTSSVQLGRLWVVLLVMSACDAEQSPQQPNIVFVLADDLGYNDVSWHNADIISPNLETLAREGVILEQSYVQPICTPSRSALMTGLYPYHLGRQHSVIWSLEPTGLTLNHTILPEYLRSLGYSTHAIGKWHLGFCSPAYLPLSRGFDSFFGFWGGDEDYYNHTHGDRGLCDDALDFWSNNRSVDFLNGFYSADLFAARAREVIVTHSRRNVMQNTNQPLFLYLPFQNVHAPLQVPKHYTDLYPNVVNQDRKHLSGMVTVLDDAVGSVVRVLKDTGMYKNTVIVFSADNGGQVLYGGNNFPLRGNKGTLWEGGTRAAAFVHSPLLAKTGYTSHQLIHITDWLPTILHLAGHQGSPTTDGFNQWETISKARPSPRHEMVYNIDNFGGECSAAYRRGEMKLVWGNPGDHNGWYPVPNQTASLTPYSEALGRPVELSGIEVINKTVMLFNLTADPTEHVDLSAQMPDLVELLKSMVTKLLETMVPADEPDADMAGLPVDGVWTTGWCTPH